MISRVLLSGVMEEVTRTKTSLSVPCRAMAA